MYSPQLDLLIDKYLSVAVVKVDELLLPREVALQFLDELTQRGVEVIECSLWKYADKEKGWVVQLLYSEFVPSELALTENPNQVVAHYLSNHLPEDAELVSFEFRHLDVYQAFSESVIRVSGDRSIR